MSDIKCLFHIKSNAANERKLVSIIPIVDECSYVAEKLTLFDVCLSSNQAMLLLLINPANAETFFICPVQLE